MRIDSLCDVCGPIQSARLLKEAITLQFPPIPFEENIFILLVFVLCEDRIYVMQTLHCFVSNGQQHGQNLKDSTLSR